LLKGVGESKNTMSSKAVKCDLFEAIVGAIYLDGGIEKAKQFFNDAIGEKLENIKVHGFVDDAKTKLQEILKQAKIVYQTTKTGVDHKPTYKTNVYINEVKMGKGVGSNKRESEEMAANQAINNLKQV
jgi:ribonuclease-3